MMKFSQFFMTLAASNTVIAIQVKSSIAGWQKNNSTLATTPSPDTAQGALKIGTAADCDIRIVAEKQESCGMPCLMVFCKNKQGEDWAPPLHFYADQCEQLIQALRKDLQASFGKGMMTSVADGHEDDYLDYLQEILGNEQNDCVMSEEALTNIIYPSDNEADFEKLGFKIPAAQNASNVDDADALRESDDSDEFPTITPLLVKQISLMDTRLDADFNQSRESDNAGEFPTITPLLVKELSFMGNRLNAEFNEPLDTNNEADQDQVSSNDDADVFEFDDIYGSTAQNSTKPVGQAEKNFFAHIYRPS